MTLNGPPPLTTTQHQLMMEFKGQIGGSSERVERVDLALTLKIKGMSGLERFGGSKCTYQGVWNKNDTLVPPTFHADVIQVLVPPQFSHKFEGRVATFSMTNA